MTSVEEPTHKRVAVVHRSDSYGPIRIYVPLVGGFIAHGDSVTVGGHTLTEDELRRGWYDPEDS